MAERFSLTEITAIFTGSNGDATRALYAHLDAIGPIGQIATNLFRAVKTSTRAKKYRKGPGHITESYSRKDWSIGNAAGLLSKMDPAPFRWGWGIDAVIQKKGDPHHHVVYFDLPSGQISFHTGARREGPDYPGKWDGAIGSASDRVCCWISGLISEDDDESCADRVINAQLDAAMGLPVDDDTAGMFHDDIFGEGR